MDKGHVVVGLFSFGLAVFERDVRDSSDCDESCETQEIIMGLDGDGRNGYHRGDDYSRFDDGVCVNFKLEDHIYNMMKILISSVDYVNLIEVYLS